jgi:hypothetical protein
MCIPKNVGGIGADGFADWEGDGVAPAPEIKTITAINRKAELRTWANFLRINSPRSVRSTNDYILPPRLRKSIFAGFAAVFAGFAVKSS